MEQRCGAFICVDQKNLCLLLQFTSSLPCPPQWMLTCAIQTTQISKDALEELVKIDQIVVEEQLEEEGDA